MKTKFYSIILLCGLVLGFVACKEEPNGETVDFTVRVTPENLQKDFIANGDTWQAVNLAYSVYKHGESTPCINETTTFDATTNTATINVKVVAGEFYDFVFFAYAEDAPYAYDASTKSVSATYTDTYEGNLEKLDAFYAFRTWEVKNNFTASVALKRAVSQVNILTGEEDYDACVAGYYTPGYTSIKINKAYRAFDLEHGEAIGTPAEVTFELGDINNVINDPANPMAGYKWLAMNYFFTNESVVDVDVVIYDDAQAAQRDLSVFNAPVQRNYRTNIYGELLMSNGEIKVVKDKNWDGEYEKEVAQPVSTVEELTKAIAKGGNYTLTNDLAVSTSLAVTENTKLDLNHNTLQLTSAINLYNEMVIENGTISSDEAIYVTILRNDAEVTYKNVEINLPEGHIVRVLEGVTGDVTIDNCNVLAKGSVVYCQSDIEVNLSNSTLKSTNSSAVCLVEGNATIENSNLTGKDAGLLFPANSHATATISRSTIKGESFGVTTNAASATALPIITITDSDIEADCAAIMLNVNGKLNLTNCNVKGGMQALIARGGTINADNSTFTLDIDDAKFENYFVSRDWGTGNMVNLSALTAGNKTTSAYQYPTVVTLTGCTLENIGPAASAYPTSYIYANQADGLGVTYNYDAATTFRGGNGIQCGSANIVVNGTAITKLTNFDNNGVVIP